MDIKKITPFFSNANQILLEREKDSFVYGNVDGLSLQNLFYTRLGQFPGCFSFDTEERTGAYRFDVKAIAKFLMGEYKGKNVEYIPYYISTIGSEEAEPSLAFCLIINDYNFYIRISSSIDESYILFDNNHEEELEKLASEISQFYIPPKGQEDTCYRIASSQGGFYLSKMKVKCPKTFDIDKMYNDSFKKEDEKISKALANEESSGLIILHGEKGTGKSTYIKHLIHANPSQKFVYVPSNMIHLFAEPSFSSFLSTLTGYVVILEDCENIIRDRKINESAAAVSLILNLTDGLLSDDLGMKFICTFNEDMKNVDSALLRKGRLISKYEFTPLCAEKAAVILEERGIEAAPKKAFTLSDIYYYEDDAYTEQKRSII